MNYGQFEEARIQAGLFFVDMLKELCISERTFYRWKKADRVPYWAYRIMELLSGDLTRLGWRNWELKNGVLYNNDLNRRYYSWLPGELLITTFCRCPAHAEAMRARKQEDRLAEVTESLRIMESNEKIVKIADRSKTRVSFGRKPRRQ